MAFRHGPYTTVAASQTNAVLGPNGNTGDILDYILVVPATTSPGAITIKDSSNGSAITLFTGGASSVSSLVPFPVQTGINGMKAVGATGTVGWLVTTGANVSIIAYGQFS